MENFNRLDSNADNDSSLYEDQPDQKTASTQDMETESREYPFSAVTDQRLLQQSLQATLASIRNFIPTMLGLWILESLRLSNMKQFETKIFPQYIENAIDSQCRKLPSRLSKTFEKAVSQRAKKEWQQYLSRFSRAVSSYGSSLNVKLELQGYLQDADFERVDDQLSLTYLNGIKDSAAVKLITQACGKIKQECQARSAWLFENKNKIECKMQEIRKRYRQEIIQVKMFDEKDLLSAHNELKKTLINTFKAEIHVPEDIVESILVKYITPLNGQLNAEYDKYIAKICNVAQDDLMPECGEKMEINDLTDEEVAVAMDGLQMSPARDTRKWPRRPNKETGVETVRIPGSSKRKEGPLFHNVREENDFHYATRVGDTDIYYFDGKIISRGSSAIVYEGRFGSATYKYHRVAVKRFLKTDENEFNNELNIWAKIDENSGDSVYVARLFSHVIWTNDLFLVIELADMDLSGKVTAIKSTSVSSDLYFPMLVGYIQDASRGLHWLHNSKNIIHRDIKPGNILIFSYNQSGSISEMAKLTDFGISRIAKDSGHAETRADGTDEWAAPEVLWAMNQDEEFVNSKSQDIFSLGLTAHFTLSLGEHPFSYSKEYGKMKILNILYPSISPSKLPHPQYTANDLIQAMISKCPENRPTSTDVLKHPLFWEVKKGLEFIIDFARIVDEKKDELVKSFREDVDKEYLEWYKEAVISENTDSTTGFDWKDTIGKDKVAALLKRKMNPGKKTYGRESLIKLVELIRDKYMHSGDMVDELKTDDHFGKNGVFNAEKYGAYFLKKFPDILSFLKGIVLRLDCEEYPDLQQLREKYF